MAISVRCLRPFGTLACLSFLMTAACSLGIMEAEEVHYYAITNGENTNYYRLRVSADTLLGVSEYRSGYFPARAVDTVFGEVTSDGATRALATRNELERAY